ncbi:MAG: pyruvate, phosphate dikinase, partial [Acidobacteria bacterium]|nr:pyruvate, phosphate dikinase [Acidobacteriota bacterium]
MAPARRKSRPKAKRKLKAKKDPAHGKIVYFFGGGKAAGRGHMKELLGGKGAGLAEMTNAGLPVPPGFTIATSACRHYFNNGNRLSPTMIQEIARAVVRLEKISGQQLGSTDAPLLVSVRSGAKFSMPGMMDTILNLGLNDQTVDVLSDRSQSPRFAWDCYRRFIQMFGNVVLEIPKEEFDQIFEDAKRSHGAQADTDLDVAALRQVVGEYKALVQRRTEKPFPQNPHKQLSMARDAVFCSWNTARARTYRRMHKIPDDLGTAVNVQLMVFGNLGENSATGVAFTRNPATGDKEFYGEFLLNAQGEDVVAGIRTPLPLSKLARLMPKVYQKLVRIAQRLERHYHDMQDFEFTIQDGKLFMLQTRTGKRTGRAAVKIACDMVREKLISSEDALLRVEPSQLEQLLHPIIDESQPLEVIAKGLPASPGAAVGRVVFTADEAVTQAASGPVILVRKETTPDDIHGMDAAVGILTARGGMTSHAAVVARGMGKCCVAGCEAIQINHEKHEFSASRKTVREGDWISLDGSTGRVILGQAKTIAPNPESGEFAKLLRWADQARRLAVRANADIPRDAKVARRFGAEGIGLCRTEHMFFPPERILAVRRMILADTMEERAAALQQILPMQRDDFFGILRAMDRLPVTIRLLDPPLHEFLPHTEEEMATLAHDLGLSDETLRRKIEGLREFNPMLGQRGCRLGIVHPEIYEVQVRALFEAACACAAEGMRPRPEIMIPLVAHVEELRILKALVDTTAREVMRERRQRVRYSVGTMIEVPRAALTAERVAAVADFFSFGTNDLTQMTLALSRDDAGRFIPTYISRGILKDDPFVTLDLE